MSGLPEEILSDRHKYWESYIAYANIKLSGLPLALSIKGHKLLKKEEFHVSLINAIGIANLINPQSVDEIELEIIKEFKNFLKKNKLDKFSLLNKFRFVQKDIKKTVIVMCEIPGAEKFFTLLSKKYKKVLPLQPFHITLYTLKDGGGIGILSNEELAKFSVPIDIPELQNIKPE